LIIITFLNRGNKNSIRQNYGLELLSYGWCVTKVACGNCARVYSNTKRWEMAKEEEKKKGWERRE
jgi:hypothetical protein